MTIRIGTIVEGFRIEGILGHGSTGTVYEATQLVLGRRVALKLLDGRLASDPVFDDRFRRAMREQAALHHPHIVSIYDAGASSHGPYIAMQLVRGTTLAALLEARSIEANRALALLAQTAEALDAAHAAGVVHGDIRPQNILIDHGERAFLTDFGLSTTSAAEPTLDADRDAFAWLVIDCLADQSVEARERMHEARRDGDASALVSLAAGLIGGTGRARRRGRSLYAVAAMVIAATAAGLIAGVGRSTHTSEREPAPPMASGAVALGSALAPGTARTVGCDGRPHGPDSPACSILQTTLSGRVVAASGDGVIRSWAVRGARGSMRLQVVRLIDGPCVRVVGGSTEGSIEGPCFARVFNSQLVDVSDQGAHTFAVDLPVKRGDLVGLALSPGAAVGLRSGTGATAVRWIGPLQIEARTPTQGEGTSFDREILLRADFLPGAQRSLPPRLTGREAAQAPTGQELDTQTRELPNGGVARVAVVRLPESVALDMFLGSERVCRIEVPDADPSGTLSVNEVLKNGDAPRSGGIPLADIRLVWINPRTAVPIEHRFALGPGLIEFID